MWEVVVNFRRETYRPRSAQSPREPMAFDKACRLAARLWWDQNRMFGGVYPVCRPHLIKVH